MTSVRLLCLLAGIMNLVLLLPHLASGVEKSSLRLRLEPHHYSRGFGQEPINQMNTYANVRLEDRKWALSSHWEFEGLGRKDMSFDIDRLWFHFPGDRVGLVVGRISPFEIDSSELSSDNFAQERHFESVRQPLDRDPWSLISSRQAQNRGVLLGSGYDDESGFADPVIMGWLGVHAYAPLGSQLELSASYAPIFLPSLGTGVVMSENAPIDSGRFAQLPPQRIVVDGTPLPLRYKVEDIDILSDVILKNQVQVQAKFTPSFLDRYEAKAFASYSPAPDATPDLSGKIKVNPDEVVALVEVTPKFTERLQGGLLQQYQVSKSLWGLTAVQGFQIEQDLPLGYEIGFQTHYVAMSFQDRLGNSETSQVDSSSSTIVVPQARYEENLLRTRTYFPILGGGRDLRWISDFKWHVHRDDFWIRSGFSGIMGGKGQGFWELGADVFAGSDTTYFGQWRANDRVYFALSWSLRS